MDNHATHAAPAWVPVVMTFFYLKVGRNAACNNFYSNLINNAFSNHGAFPPTAQSRRMIP